MSGVGPIVVIGAPGAGKSTVGRLLADRMGLDFVDVDVVIEQGAGRPIREIFADDGEAAFREIEATTTVAQLLPGRVVALGGGAVMTAAIREALADHVVVWLEVTAATAIGRAGLNAARPLLLGNVRGTLIRLLNERTPVYRSVATHAVTNDDDDPQPAVEAILARLDVTGTELAR